MAKEKSKVKKGRDTFSTAEIEKIRELIVQKCNADSSKQKSIRSKMRDMDFYITDFRNDITSVEEFDSLLTNGEINCSDSKTGVYPSGFDQMKKTIANTTNVPVSGRRNGTYDDIKKGLAPVVGDNPKILILGTLPGDESIRLQQYYSQKRNRFWKIIFSLLGDGEIIPYGYEEKIQFLKDNGIALWDVLSGAKRPGSLDSNIQDEEPNDLISFLKNYPTIKMVIFNSEKTKKIFDKYFSGVITDPDIKLVTLLSTSSSNCKHSTSELLTDWQIIKKI